MKNLPLLKLNLLAGLVLAVGLIPLRAIDRAQWQSSQPITLEAAAPTRLTLPPEVLDRAQADLRDLRVLSPEGAEVPYVVLRAPTTTRETRAARGFHVVLQGDDTVITFATGSTQPLDLVRLQSPTASFLAPAKIELSGDGDTWETLIEGTPFFRQEGVEQTSFDLHRKRAAHVRITLSRARYGSIVVTGAATTEAGQLQEKRDLTGVTFSREEFDGETVLTVDLGVANQPVLSLELEADDALFNRNVTASIRTWTEAGVVEKALATDSIYRVRYEGLIGVATTERMSVAVGSVVPARELILRIENADSAPLAIKAVRAVVRPVDIVISPLAAGRHALLAGNPDVRAPRYDLAAFAEEFLQLKRSTVRLDAMEVNAGYQRADPLGGLTAEGSQIDASAWSFARAVVLKAAGVQQLELDLAVLAAARTDYADLRLVRGGQQVPYILEHTALLRKLVVTPQLEPDAKQPSLSRWKLPLPYAQVPVRRLTLRTSAALFQRQFTVYQLLRDYRGDTYRQTLATQTWTRQPGSAEAACEIAFAERVRGEALWMETDNGDNPPLVLTSASISFPVVRLLMKTVDAAPLTLLYGRMEVSAPRYDLGLMAGRLLAAEKQTATLSAETQAAPSARGAFFKNASTSAIFWAVLATVVVVLFVIIAKLLPKPPPPAAQ